MLPPVTPPHLVQVQTSGFASEVIANDCKISIETALAFIRLGAVYSNRLRLMEDQRIEAKNYLRIYFNPRRFPISSQNWEDRVLENTSEFVVVNKPPGLPVHPTCDNGAENVAFQLGRFLNAELKVVHRLDIPTQGLMAFGKTREFVRLFNRALENGEVQKRYRALIPTPVRTGKIIHHMENLKRAPYWVADQLGMGTKRCEMIVESVIPHRRLPAYEAEISLITGRHHQIRSQLAFLGSPILGDSLYGSATPLLDANADCDVIGLQAFEISFPSSEGKKSFSILSPWNAL